MSNNETLHIFGEVLFDHFSGGIRVLGGAPFNVAWHLEAFGQSPRFISRVGDDPAGQEIVALMDTWGMSRNALQTDCEHPTGRVRVLIQDGEPHYEIVADCAYDFIDGKLLETKSTQGALYHGSLAIRNPVAHAALQTVKALHQGKIFVDVNLRPPWWARETLLPLLQDADWVKLNEAELAALCPESPGLEAAMLEFYELFDLETLVVTRGEKGAVACDRRQHFMSVKPLENLAVVDTVGAGDAFAALLLMGLNQGWSLEDTLERAQEFACALVGKRGATVSDREFYRAFIEKWG
ncbi:MAG: carbohydrate kinase [Methylococcales bacterium]|nr:carbohydrate kinase [Methylococcales bacterium]